MTDRNLVQTISGLEIREEIGSGGMGAVFKAYQPALDRIVALKTVRPELLTREGLELFQQEARLLAKCNHPNIVRILEFHPEHKAPYFLMEFVDGIPIDQALRGQSWSDITGSVKSVVDIVAAAHQVGVVHGDLKPKNILVDRQSKPWVLDFGLARLAGSQPREIESTSGTPAYMAPEMFDGVAATIASDIYALGVTLYQLVTGVMPYQTPVEAMAGQARLPCELNSDIPEPLQRICLKALERDPQDRYQTAEQLAQDLDRFCKDQPIFVRPTRYQQELDGRVRNHVTDLQMWKREGLVTQRESDSLTREYQRILDSDSPWLSDVRSLVTGPMFIRLGSWLLLLSALLCPVFYWHLLGDVARLLATGIPTLLMAIVGSIYLSSGRRRYALACFGSFVLLLTVFQITLMAQFGWFRYLQPPEQELLAELDWREFHAAYVGMSQSAVGPPGRSFRESPIEYDPSQFDKRRAISGPQQGLPPPPSLGRSEFLLSNSQLFVVALTATLCICLLFYLLQASFFAPWLAIAICFLFATVTLLIGDWEWVRNGKAAWVAAHYVLLAAILYALGIYLEKRTAPRIGKPFYYLALLVGGVAAVLLSGFATHEWFHQSWTFRNELWNFWLMSYAALCFVWAWQTEHYGPEGQRVLTRWIYLLVPLFLLIPLQLLFSQGFTILVINFQPIHIFAVVYLLACAALLLLGRAFQLEIFIVASLWGSAVWVLRMTMRHFLEYEAWVAAVGGAGIVAVGLGVWFSLRADKAYEEPRQRAKATRQDFHVGESPAEMETIPAAGDLVPTDGPLDRTTGS